MQFNFSRFNFKNIIVLDKKSFPITQVKEIYQDTWRNRYYFNPSTNKYILCKYLINHPLSTLDTMVIQTTDIQIDKNKVSIYDEIYQVVRDITIRMLGIYVYNVETDKLLYGSIAYTDSKDYMYIKYYTKKSHTYIVPHYIYNEKKGIYIRESELISQNSTGIHFLSNHNWAEYVRWHKFPSWENPWNSICL